MKASMKNARFGSPAHNGRTFDLNNNDGHIDVNLMELNVYWSVDHATVINNTCDFKKAELSYYKEHYSDALEKQNERHRKSRHEERIKTINDIYKNTQTKPEETILQIGNRNDFIDHDKFTACVEDYIRELEKYSSNLHVLDYAIHFDEPNGGPHVHIRRVWDYENEQGDRVIGMDRALKELGFERPDPNMKKGRTNNRKMTFDAVMREKWYDICEDHGFQIERAPSQYTRGGLTKEEMILSSIDHEIEVKRGMVTALQKTIEEMEHVFEHRQEELEHAISDTEQQLSEKKEELGELQKEADTLRAEILRYYEEKELIEKEEKEKRKRKMEQMRTLD